MKVIDGTTTACVLWVLTWVWVGLTRRVYADTFHAAWGNTAGVSAGEPIPSGTKHGQQCSFKNDRINFLWESLDAQKPFFDVVVLNESQWQYNDRTDNRKMFVLPESFSGIRHPPELLKTFRNYKNITQVCSKQNHQAVSLRTPFYDDLMNIAETNRPRRMAIFHNVVTNNYGLIADPKDCRFVRNAGCWYMKHTRIYAMAGDGVSHDVVISLTAGASGTWHFPMECFVALAGVDEDILRNAVIHVPSKSSFIMGWLQLLNISNSHVTDAPVVRAKTLYVPEMGRCGETFPTQIQWMRGIVGLPLDRQTVNTAIPPVSSSNVNSSIQLSILLIQRTGSRLIRNPQEVEHHVKAFASKNVMNFINHHDQHLPPLREQIHRFSQANIIVAPHGAALLFSTFAPPNACIIEFMPILNPECYARIAYLRHVHYIMYTMDNGAAIKMNELEEGMELCRKLVTQE
jgi:hypothetical protein